MTRKQLDQLDKWLNGLSIQEWGLFWRWATLRYMERMAP